MSTLSKQELQQGADIVYAHMTPTPQICWPLLSQRVGAEVWVKHENHAPTGAFKVRGGLTYMARLKAEQPQCPGVVAATRGNHGQSIALAAAKSDMSATILVPYGNNPEKNAAMRAYGAELIEHGTDFEEARLYANDLAEDRSLHMVPSFSPWLVQGVASYGMELFTAVPDLDTVYVPIGLGSGICSVIAARDAMGATADIVGVVAENAASYALSFEAKKAISTNSADTLADGMACRVPDMAALEIIWAGADRVITLSEADILDAMGIYFKDTHNSSEGAGAAPLAGLIKEKSKMKGKKVGLILSGGNADAGLFSQALARAQ